MARGVNNKEQGVVSLESGLLGQHVALNQVSELPDFKSEDRRLRTTPRSPLPAPSFRCVVFSQGSKSRDFKSQDTRFETTPRSTLHAPRFTICILLFLTFLAACSPKIVVPPSVPPVVTAPPRPVPVPERRRVNTFALILPFQLDKITTRTIQQKDITRSELALDFYQGFKLALDSLALKGTDFKLEVLDSRDNNTQAIALAKSMGVQNSDIIIGPVFPDGIKAFTAMADLREKLVVSPLAAAAPAQFNNSKLVTLNNTADQHAWKIADFINRHYNPDVTNIVLVNTRKNVDETFAAPIRKQLSSLSSGKLLFTEVPNMIGIESKLSRTKTNVVIVTSYDKSFVGLSINGLYKLRSSYKIDVFGHPNWAKTDLETEKIEALNTRITSSYFINEKSQDVARFIAGYKRRYLQTPSEYAFKGFDTGYLFGSLLARHGRDYARHLNNEKFKGLHNNFEFSYSPGIGYTNTNVMMLRYRGFALVAEE